MAEAQWCLCSFEDQFDDQLVCSVCLDQYTNPKTLPCHHSFCLECIQPLPVEIKEGKYYIICPTCRVDSQIPQEGAANLPNAFHINSLLDLRKKLSISKIAQQTATSSVICPKHNDPLKIYCETCCQVICRDCTISKEHATHNFSLITECYPKHHQQIQDSLDLVKHKLADVSTAVTELVTREREVIQQGQQLKEKINTHAQQIIDQVQRSHILLSQEVDTIVQQKTQVLTGQRQQAQKLQTQLETCQEMIEQSLREWTKQQILAEKHMMMDEVNVAIQHVDPTVFQPIEKADTQFTKTNTTAKIGFITSTTYGKATFKANPCYPKQLSTATLTLQSRDGSPLSLPPSLISSRLSSPGSKHSIKCDIAQTSHPGKYSIAFTPATMHDQLTILIGGVAISNGIFTLPTLVMRGELVKATLIGIHKPRGIAICDDGSNIIVAESGAHRIAILTTKKGEKVKSFGSKGSKKGQFICPRGVAVSIDGLILVTDSHRLQKLATDGVCVKSVGSSNSGSGRLQFSYPKGITVHPTTGQIFVADSFNNRIQVFTNDLTFSHTITVHGSMQFNMPFGVALDNEHLYVAELGNHCITKLTTTGQYIARFGSYGSAPGQLYCPSSLTINDNFVYVSEYDNNRVSIFDTTGKFLHCFGKKGSGEGEFNGLYGIAMDVLGNLYVSDKFKNRIVVY